MIGEDHVNAVPLEFRKLCRCIHTIHADADAVEVRIVDHPVADDPPAAEDGDGAGPAGDSGRPSRDIAQGLHEDADGEVRCVARKNRQKSVIKRRHDDLAVSSMLVYRPGERGGPKVKRPSIAVGFDLDGKADRYREFPEDFGEGRDVFAGVAA